MEWERVKFSSVILIFATIKSKQISSTGDPLCLAHLKGGVPASNCTSVYRQAIRIELIRFSRKMDCYKCNADIHFSYWQCESQINPSENSISVLMSAYGSKPRQNHRQSVCSIAEQYGEPASKVTDTSTASPDLKDIN